MTDDRKTALKWMHERGVVAEFPIDDERAPSRKLLKKLIESGEVERVKNDDSPYAAMRLTAAGVKAVEGMK